MSQVTFMCTCDFCNYILCFSFELQAARGAVFRYMGGAHRFHHLPFDKNKPSQTLCRTPPHVKLQTKQHHQLISLIPGKRVVMGTYLCSDHDDFENLHPEFPGKVSPGPVLLTRAHEVKLEVVSQVLLFDNILSCDRAETTQHSKVEKKLFSYHF